MIKKILPKLFIGMDNYLSITVGIKAATRLFQLFPQFNVIKNLSVKDHPQGFILIVHRLFSASQIDDAKPALSQPDIILDIIPVIIRPSVVKDIGHPLQDARIYFLMIFKMKDACYSAHWIRLRVKG